MNGKKARLLRKQAGLKSTDVATYKTTTHHHKPIFAAAGGIIGFHETKTLSQDTPRSKYHALKLLYKIAGV